jgi:hypothetical protein
MKTIPTVILLLFPTMPTLSGCRGGLDDASASFERDLESHMDARPGRLLDAAWTVDSALGVLRDISSRNPHVVFDGQERLCLLGSIKYQYEDLPPSTATVVLYDLRESEGWDMGFLWKSKNAQEVSNAVFVNDNLVVDWEDVDGMRHRSAIAWQRGDTPNAGRFEDAVQPTDPTDGATRRR